MKSLTYTVTDDSGFLALIDPAAYAAFVSADWTLHRLIQHFKTEMRHEHLAIWGTGREDVWRVDVTFENPAPVDFREFSTTIRASGGHLLLTNYESLTMAAQFDDVRLPEPRQTNLLIPLQTGLYCCRVIQRFNPDASDPPVRAKLADFVIELTTMAASEKIKGLTTIPWTEF